MDKKYMLDTIAVQGGYKPNNGDPRVVPIVQSTTYKYDNAKSVADWFDLKADGHIYSRLSNPTDAVLEDKVAQLEGGVAAIACSSGQSANLLAVLNICQSGQHIISSTSIYGGTFNLFFHTMKKMGIDVTFVNQEQSLDELKKLVRPETRLIFAETLSNPNVDVLDFEKFSTLAKFADVPFIVDNTFATPYLCNPFDFGANIITHSSTKYIDGHATSVGGIVVDKGDFNWFNGKYPEMTNPDPSYHGTVFGTDFGKAGYIMKIRGQLIRDLGNYLAPMNAWLSNLGLETLHLRMERHSSNALKLATFLSQHKDVAWVKYPGLPTDKNYELSKKYLPKGCSGVFTFGLKGGRSVGEKFMNSLKLAAIVVHVADVRTSVLHPASMTHRQLSDEQQIKAGISPDLIRVSVGIEHIDDIIKDFDDAIFEAMR